MRLKRVDRRYVSEDWEEPVINTNTGTVPWKVVAEVYNRHHSTKLTDVNCQLIYSKAIKKIGAALHEVLKCREQDVA